MVQRHPNNLNVFQYLYTVLLYMPDYKNEPVGIEKLLPWSDFIKERCSGLIDVKNQTPEALRFRGILRLDTMYLAFSLLSIDCL